jgi:hypothetical protein
MAADHPIRQSRLEGLVDDAVAIQEIRSALGHECIEGNISRHAATQRFENGDDSGRFVRSLNSPYTLAAIAAVLLDDARPRRLQAVGKLIPKLRESGIATRIRAT